MLKDCTAWAKLGSVQTVRSAIFATCVSAGALIACQATAPPLQEPAITTRTAPPTPSRLAPVVAPQKAAPASAPALKPAKAQHQFGQATSLVVGATSAIGAWVAFCQTTEDTNHDGQLLTKPGPLGGIVGDTMQRFIAVGSSSPQPVADLLAYDRTGHYLVVSQEGGLWLLNAVTNERFDLSGLDVDLERDAAPYGTHRTVTFNPSGTRLALARGRPNGFEVVVVDVQKPTRNHVIDGGDGVLVRMSFDRLGRALVLEVVAEDSTGNSKLDWPIQHRPLKSWRCAGHSPIPNYGVWPRTGDGSTIRMASTDATNAEDVPGFVGTFGGGVTRRLANGSLVVQQGSSEQLLVDAKCDAKVLHVDPVREQLLGICTGGNIVARGDLTLFGRQLRISFDAKLRLPRRERWHSLPDRLVPVYPGMNTVIVDMHTRRSHELMANDSVIKTLGAHALVLRGDQLLFIDIESDHQTIVAGNVESIPDVLRANKTAVVTPWIVDMPTKRVLGQVPGRPIAVSDAGHVLIALGGDASAKQLAVGPLVWKAPLNVQPEL